MENFTAMDRGGQSWGLFWWGLLEMVEHTLEVLGSMIGGCSLHRGRGVLKRSIGVWGGGGRC